MKPCKIAQIVKLKRPLYEFEKDSKFQVRDFFFDIEKHRVIVEFMDSSI